MKTKEDTHATLPCVSSEFVRFSDKIPFFAVRKTKKQSPGFPEHRLLLQVLQPVRLLSRLPESRHQSQHPKRREAGDKAQLQEKTDRRRSDRSFQGRRNHRLKYRLEKRFLQKDQLPIQPVMKLHVFTAEPFDDDLLIRARNLDALIRVLD